MLLQFHPSLAQPPLALGGRDVGRHNPGPSPLGNLACGLWEEAGADPQLGERRALGHPASSQRGCQEEAAFLYQRPQILSGGFSAATATFSGFWSPFLPLPCASRGGNVPPLLLALGCFTILSWFLLALTILCIVPL